MRDLWVYRHFFFNRRPAELPRALPAKAERKAGDELEEEAIVMQMSTLQKSSLLWCMLWCWWPCTDLVQKKTGKCFTNGSFTAHEIA